MAVLCSGSTEVGQCGFGANLAAAVVYLALDEDHVAHLAGETGADGQRAIVAGGDGLDILYLHLRRHARGVQQADDHPARHLVEEHRLHAAVQGVHPSLVVGRGCPLADDVAAIFPKLKVETDGIVRAAPYAVVALVAEPRIVNLLHGRKGFCLVLFDGLYVETHRPEAIIATLRDHYGAL